jgi:hypothetical protein
MPISKREDGLPHKVMEEAGVIRGEGVGRRRDQWWRESEQREQGGDVINHKNTPETHRYTGPRVDLGFIEKCGSR